MKITFEHEGITTTVDDKNAIDIYDVLHLVYQGLMGVGFHPSSVKEGFIFINEEINPEYDAPSPED